MISHAHQCIFIHQRKCAGSSIMATFDHSVKQYVGEYRLGGDNEYTDEWLMFNDGVLSDHPCKWEEKEKRYSNYFVFAVVRNPYDRFVSGWKYCTSTKKKTIAEVLDNLPQEGHDYEHITRLQTQTLLNERGELVADFLIRFEHLQDDYNLLCDMIGKNERRIVPAINASERLPHKHYFNNPELVKKFRDIFQIDIDFWEAHSNEKQLTL